MAEKPDKDKITSSHMGHRQRMKEKFMLNGFEGMADHEVLEFMLFFVLKQGDTNETAHKLIERFGNIGGVLEADYDSLLEIPGIKENAACYLKSMLPLFRRYSVSGNKKQKLNDSSNCGDYLLGHFIGLKNEKVMVLSLDSSCKVISLDTVCEGEICSASFNLRRLVEITVKSKAAAVVLAHNHPGGIALPSREDVNATVSVKNALSVIGVALIDHIIIADGDYISMADTKSFKSIFLS